MSQLQLSAADLLNALDDPSLIVRDGTIQTVNDAFLTLTASEADEVQGGSMDDYLVNGVWSDCSEDEPTNMTLQTPDGAVIPVTLSVSPIPNGSDGVIVQMDEVYSKKVPTEQLRRDRSVYRTLFNAVSTPMLVHDLSSGKIIQLNAAARQLFDLDGEVPYDLQTLCPDNSPYTASQLQQFIQSAANENDPMSFTWKVPVSDGSVWVRLNLTTVDFEYNQHILTSARDITDLKTTRNRLEELTEATDDIFWMFNGDWTETLFVNSAYERVFGWDREALKEDPTSFLDYIHPEDREQVQNAMIKLSTGETVNIEYRVNPITDGDTPGTWDGDPPAWINVVGNPIEDNTGTVTRMVGIARDITERKHTENELLERTYALEQSNQDLKRFANVVTHDLKQPLRKINSFADLLDQTEPSDSDFADYLDSIQDGTHRMARLLDRLREFSDINFSEPASDRVSVNELIQTVWEDLEPRGSACLELDDCPDIQGDESLLESLFRNLLDNALTYSDGSVTVRVYYTKSGETGCFHVEDNGMGIPPDNQDQIFAVFKRLHTRDDIDGTGLGLATAQKIVRHHDGTMTVESTPGDGSDFQVVLPRSRCLESSTSHQSESRCPETVPQ